MGGVIPQTNFNKKPSHKEKKVSFYEFQKRYNPISPTLEKMLNQKPWSRDYIGDETLIDIEIMLNPNFLPFINFRSLEKKFSGSTSVKVANGQKTYFLNGKKENVSEIEDFAKLDAFNAKKVQEYRRKLIKKATSLLTLDSKYLSKIAQFRTNKSLLRGEQNIRLKLKKSKIASFVKENKNLLLYVGIKKDIKPLMVSQAQQSNVNPVAFNGYHTQGQNIDVLYTEEFCPSPSWFNNTRYSIIDGTSAGTGGFDSDHTRLDGDILRYGASQSNLFCGGYNNSANSQFNNVPNAIDVENYSWGEENSNIDREYDQLSAGLDNHIYNSRNTVCVSAGNIVDGFPNSRYVNSPAKALNAITVGAYFGGQISDFSAWGNSDILNEKPEVLAEGEHINDSKLGALQFRGTSFASPHVAAIVADYMSRLGADWNHRAIGMKALIMASATDSVGEREDLNEDVDDKSVGVGGVKYNIYNYQIWEMFDGTSKEFTRTFHVSQTAIDQGKSLRVVLTWLNRGDYTIAHKGHAKISLDLDLFVTDPNGISKGVSNSWDNPYEVVNFKPTIAGNYTNLCI